MTPPRIVDPTPAENASAHEHCRRILDHAVEGIAAQLREQPLSIKALIGRLLIEDFAALDVNATTDWLRANSEENVAAALGHDKCVDVAREHRRAAFTRLAQAEIARGRS